MNVCSVLSIDCNTAVSIYKDCKKQLQNWSLLNTSLWRFSVKSQLTSIQESLLERYWNLFQNCAPAFQVAVVNFFIVWSQQRHWRKFTTNNDSTGRQAAVGKKNRDLHHSTSESQNIEIKLYCGTSILPFLSNVHGILLCNSILENHIIIVHWYKVWNLQCYITTLILLHAQHHVPQQWDHLTNLIEYDLLMFLLRRVSSFNLIVHALYWLIEDEKAFEIYNTFTLCNVIHSDLSVLNYNTFYFEKKMFSNTDCD